MPFQPLLQTPRAITIGAGPWFGPIEVAAVFAIVRVFHAEKFKKLLPIGAFFGQRSRAETSFHPVSNALLADACLLHVINVFVARNGTGAQRFVFNGF